MPLGVSNRNFFLASYVHSHADGSAYGCQICSQSVWTAVWHLSNIFEFVTPNPLQMSLGARGANLFSLFPFPDELYTYAMFGPDRSRGLEAFPDL